jgi:putative transposase
MPELKQTSVVKIRMQLSSEAKETLDGQSKICNWLYNQLLDRANQMREVYRQTQDPEIGKTLYTERGLRNLIPEIKKEKPFLKVVHSSPLKNAALRASGAIQTYQKSRKGKRRGKLAGWPHFRSWNRGWFSLLYDEPGKGFRLEGSRLTLSLGMGLDREQRRLSGTLDSIAGLKDKEIRNLRIVKQLGVFFAVFTVRVALPEQKPIIKAIALDPNHKNLAYGVGTDEQAVEIAAPSWIKRIDKRIDELSAKRDRCKRKSQKIYKKK